MIHSALALKDDPPPVDEVWNSDDEQRRLRELMEVWYTRILTAVHHLVATALPLPNRDTFRLDDPATRRVLQQAAHRVVRIDETTRQAISNMLQIGQERGYSAWQIAHGVIDEDYAGIDGLFKERWAGRADTVARTELQEAQRLSAIDRYHATGLVDRVKIIDGDYDEACARRNGKVVPIEQAPELLHPNCTLVLTPVLRDT